jgi:hypothetical protein
MPTILEIPESTKRQAERYAQAKGISSSELFTQAMNDFLAKESSVTEQLNQVYADSDSRLDSKLHKMQMVSLPPEDWS